MPTGATAPKWFSDSRRIAFISHVWPWLATADAARRLRERRESKMTARAWEHAPFSHWDRFLDDRVPHVFVTDVDGRKPYSPTLASGQHLEVREPGQDSYDVAPGGAARDLTADNQQSASDFGAEQGRFGEFWQRPAEFAAQSPHLAAGQFSTPTLILHGQLDLRIPISNGFELFNVLQNRGVPSKLVYFPDENHWISRPQNSLYWYAAIRDWLARYAPP